MAARKRDPNYCANFASKQLSTDTFILLNLPNFVYEILQRIFFHQIYFLCEHVRFSSSHVFELIEEARKQFPTVFTM